MVNVGVIGAGLMGSTHARLLATAVSGAEVVAVSDALPESAARVAEETGRGHDPRRRPRADRQPRRRRRRDRSPAATHEPFALACMEAGKPVLCEKPLAVSAAAALRIVEAEAALGRRLVTVGFMRRYDPGYADMKARLDAGAIGAPLLVHCAHRNPSVHVVLRLGDDHHRHRRPRGRHHRWLLGEEIMRVDRAHAAAVLPRARGPARPAAAPVRDGGGQIVDVEAFVSAGYAYDIRCEVVGEDGTLELLPPATVAVRDGATPSRWRSRRASGAVRGRVPQRAAGLGRPIRRGEEPSGPSAWDGYAAAAVCEAAVASSEPAARSTSSL